MSIVAGVMGLIEQSADGITARLMADQLGIKLEQVRDALRNLSKRKRAISFGIGRDRYWIAGYSKEKAAKACAKRLAELMTPEQAEISIKRRQIDRARWRKRKNRIGDRSPFIHRRVSKWRPIQALPGPRFVFELA